MLYNDNTFVEQRLPIIILQETHDYLRDMFKFRA